MVVNQLNLEILYVILEMYFLAFLYFWDYMTDDHVILETSFTDNLHLCNVGIT
jgi:hypothetical protein